jgi:undecaprenyl-diphosphatase
MGTESASARRPWWLPLFPLMLIVATGACGLALTRYGPASFDVPLLLWFRAAGDTGRLAGPEGTAAFWLGVTWLGEPTPRLVVTGLAILGLSLRRRWHSALFLAGVVLSGIALTVTIKLWVGRPRPQWVAPLDQVGLQSFPSGHALNGMLAYLAVALVLAPLLHQRVERWALYFAAASLSLAIGVSRIALGVHYPTDVIAGWVIGAAWLWLWFFVARHSWPKALP